MTLAIGTKLYGYCGGFFGRDSYSNKRVEAVGVDWVVVRNEYEDVEFARNHDSFDIHEELAKYTKPDEDEG